MESTDRPAVTPRQPHEARETRSPQPPTRSEPWYDDGNIIIEAETTQFRLYKGILSDSSRVLNDMFGVPQSAEDEVIIDGCPVRKVSGSADDWKFVLDALYKQSHVHSNHSPLTFPIVAAFLRLGTEYDIESLRSQAITRLRYEFPSTLEAMDHYQRRLMITPITTSNHFELVDLARQYGPMDILPGVLYVITATVPLKATFRGVHHGGKHPGLRIEDQQSCAMAWRTLHDLEKERTFSWLYTEAPNPIFGACSTQDQCHVARAYRLLKMVQPPTNISPFGRWDGVLGYGMCSSCVAAAQRSHQEGRQNTWEALPSIFGLPGWQELVNAS